MRSMMESFERWSINGEPDAPRDASPVPREDCRNLCPKGIRRCFPTLLCGSILVLIVGRQHREQSSDVGGAQRCVSVKFELCGDAENVRQRNMERISCISRGNDHTGSGCQRRHRGFIC